jgi:hypothetical protein
VESISIWGWLLLSVQFLTLIAALIGMFLAMSHQKTLDIISFQVDWRIKQMLAEERAEEALNPAREDEALRRRHEPR